MSDFAARSDDAVELSQPVPAGIQLSLTCHRQYDFTGPAYAELHGASTATAFQHPLWMDAFFRHLAQERGAEPVIVVGRHSETGRPEFILPLIRRSLSGVTLLEATDLGVSDYAAPVVRRSWSHNAIDAAQLQRMVRDALPPFDILRIKPVRESALPLWQTFFAGSVEREDYSSHAAHLTAPYAEWREKALGRSFRKYLDRRKKRFLKSGEAKLRLLKDPDEIRHGISEIRRLRAGRFDGDVIQQDFAEKFYAEIATRGSRQDFARTYALTLDGQDIGFVFGLTQDGRFLYLLIGCDYETHGRHSPGLLMYDMIIEDWIGDDGNIFDFTIGDEGFKADFGTAPTAIFAIRQAPTLLGKLALAGYASRDRIREWLRPGSEKHE